MAGLAALWISVPSSPWPSPHGPSLLPQLQTPYPPSTAPKSLNSVFTPLGAFLYSVFPFKLPTDVLSIPTGQSWVHRQLTTIGKA